MQRPAILVVLNNSLGEIHFILPYLARIKSEVRVEIYLYFINEKIYYKAVDDPFYYDQIVEHAVILKPNDLFSFLLKQRKRVALILKDTTPLTEKNIAIRIKQLCPHATLTLFPHAYALLGYQDDVVKKGKTVRVEDQYVNSVLYVHPFDVPTLALRYAQEKLMFAGALGYSPWWSQVVEDYVKKNQAKLGIQVLPDRLTVLLTLRDVHKQFLDENNFNYLFSSSLDVLFNTTEFFIIIKPHPRQDIGKLKQFLADFDSSRYTISYFNTFVLSNFSDLNLSFWSSAVTDCLAMGIPSLEFHRFHMPFNQTIETNGTLESFYSYLGLTKRLTSREELEKALPADRTEIQNLYIRQKKELDRIFSDTDLGFNNFRGLIENRKAVSQSPLVEQCRTFIYFFLKFIFRTFKPV